MPSPRPSPGGPLRSGPSRSPRPPITGYSPLAGPNGPARNSPEGGPASSVIRCIGPVAASADSSSGPACMPSRSGTPGSPGGRAPGSAAAVGSTVTASWMLRPSSLDRVLVIRARSRVSSCSFTNSLGVAIRAVFSTRPSGLVSCSQARWAGSICIPASSARLRAQTSARSASLIGRSPRAPTYDQQVYPQVVHVALWCSKPSPWPPGMMRSRRSPDPGSPRPGPLSTA